jgi:hypothetical protein
MISNISPPKKFATGSLQRKNCVKASFLEKVSPPYDDTHAHYHQG